MTLSVSRRRQPRRRGRRSLLWLLALAVAFVLGVGLGEALHDGPPHGSQTLVRTLHPLPLVPVAGGSTVTVTTSNP